MNQPLRKLSAMSALARINVTNVKIEGAWMPCEYEQDKNGRVRIVMLADIDVEEPKRHATWHRTVEIAAWHAFENLSLFRKVSVRELIRGRAIEDCPFKQLLKRNLLSRVV